MPGKDPAREREYDNRYSTRVRGCRAMTIAARARKKCVVLPVVAGPSGFERPQTRGDCAAVQRPCPWAGCRHHLFLDVNERGGLKLNFPDLEPGQLLASCSLDIADAGPAKLEHAGALMNLTRERIRQVELMALQKLARTRVLREFK